MRERFIPVLSVRRPCSPRRLLRQRLIISNYGQPRQFIALLTPYPSARYPLVRLQYIPPGFSTKSFDFSLTNRCPPSYSASHSQHDRDRQASAIRELWAIGETHGI